MQPTQKAARLISDVARQQMHTDIENFISELKKAYPIRVIDGEGTYNFRVEGLEEEFHISDDSDEFTLFTNVWHEHFDTIQDVRYFLDDLFNGIVEIVVKYRGETPVSHSVKIITEDGERIASKTGSLISPVWRKKTIKIHKYKLADKSL